MKDQNFENHPRFVAGYHIILTGLLIVGVVTSIVNIWLQVTSKDEVLEAILIALLFVCGGFIFWYMRVFPLKAQDRAIRAEESLRYFILTRKALDSRVTMAQIIALRFAPDEEFVPLVDRAINEKLTPKEIKQAIKQWRADHHRI